MRGEDYTSVEECVVCMAVAGWVVHSNGAAAKAAAGSGRYSVAVERRREGGGGQIGCCKDFRAWCNSPLYLSSFLELREFPISLSVGGCTALVRPQLTSSSLIIHKYIVGFMITV